MNVAQLPVMILKVTKYRTSTLHCSTPEKCSYSYGWTDHAGITLFRLFCRLFVILSTIFGFMVQPSLNMCLISGPVKSGGTVSLLSATGGFIYSPCGIMMCSPSAPYTFFQASAHGTRFLSGGSFFGGQTEPTAPESLEPVAGLSAAATLEFSCCISCVWLPQDLLLPAGCACMAVDSATAAPQAPQLEHCSQAQVCKLQNDHTA